MKRLLMAVAFTAGLAVPVAAEDSVYMSDLGLKTCAEVDKDVQKLGEVYKVGTEIFALGYLNAVSIMLYANADADEGVPDKSNVPNIFLATVQLYCFRNPSASYIEAIAGSLESVTEPK